MLGRWFGSRDARVTRRDAERLLDGEPTGPAHDGLTNLLAAAAAPVRPGELAGERTAVAAFRAAVRERPYPGRAGARPARRRRVAVVGAVSAVVLAVGGTAYAAGTGRLPDPVQRVVDAVLPGGSGGPGVPAPSVGSAGAPPGTVSPATPGGAGPGPASAGPGAGPDRARLVGLCRSWEATRTNPNANAISADDLRVLATAAGGQERVEAFCAELQGRAPGPTKTGKPGNPNPGGGRPTAPPGGGRTKGGPG